MKHLHSTMIYLIKPLIMLLKIVFSTTNTYPRKNISHRMETNYAEYLALSYHTRKSNTEMSTIPNQTSLIQYNHQREKSTKAR